METAFLSKGGFNAFHVYDILNKKLRVRICDVCHVLEWSLPTNKFTVYSNGALYVDFYANEFVVEVYPYFLSWNDLVAGYLVKESTSCVYKHVAEKHSYFLFDCND